MLLQSFRTSFYNPQRLLNIIVLLSMLLLFSGTANAQYDNMEYEDITVLLLVENIGGYEIDAIYKDDNIYVSVATLFQILKINHTLSKGNDSITGFFLSEQNQYSVNAENNTVYYEGKRRNLSPGDVFRTEFGIFLKNTLYGEIFGLNLNFNFRSLTLELKTALDLPVIKELRQAQMRKNIDQLTGIVEVDTTINRKYHLLRGGMADWSVISMQSSNKLTDTRAAIAAGAELFGGEATAMLNYSSVTGFDERQQQYRWRWVNNESHLIKQVQLGKIPAKSTSSLYSPFIGASVTNTPTTFRKSFGKYTLTDFTEPGWTVELYINNVLVDFTTADASGFFSFDVPLVYGSSSVVLKFYGPWGEERVREQTLNIPYNFIPVGTIEYNILGGVLRDSSNSVFSRAETMVGIHRNLTMGGGVEYLSSLTKDNAMPFITASAGFLRNFLFTGEYTHGVKTRSILNYRLPSSLVVEVDYTKYVPGQKAISFNYLEERKASISVPVKIGSFRSFARTTYRQNVLPLTTYSSSELLISSFYSGVSSNIAVFANWLPGSNPYIYSNVALGFRLKHGIQFRPQVQFDITNNKLTSYKAEVEKSFSQKAHFSFNFENNIRSNYKSVELTFRYDLPFAQTMASARYTQKNVTTTESARGSFAFGSGNGYVHTDNRSATGRAALTIRPFLDLNNNNVKEDAEPIVSGLSMRLNGGRVISRKDDSLIRIIELEPYASYLLELEDTGFENIAWQLNLHAIRIITDPNQFKIIDIPVKVMGEANGMVLIRKGDDSSGLGRILINFYDESGNLVNRVLSESDGYFNYLGLPPGKYTAEPDKDQLNRLELKAEPASFEFIITPSSYGDIIDDINFMLDSTKAAIED
jgi:hypothetical protein